VLLKALAVACAEKVLLELHPVKELILEDLLLGHQELDLHPLEAPEGHLLLVVDQLGLHRLHQQVS
jgi:hypothetical protein